MDMGVRPCLSVVMPCYNEAETVAAMTEQVLASPYVAELIVVDDGSTDGTREILGNVRDARVRVLEQPMNCGKGAALRRGFREASADYVIVQDADLEYDPADYEQMLAPLLGGRADVVYGSRFSGGRERRVLYFWHEVGNKLLTLASNMFTNLNLTDMETCYKAFRREVIQSIEIEEDRFGFEPEITAKIAKGGWRVYEVGVTYAGRTYAEGKKIGWTDGVRAVYSVVRYSRLADRMEDRVVDRKAETVSFDMADSELESTLDSLSNAPNYARWIVSMCEPHLGKDVLEVGAGHGALTRLLAEDRNVTATELSRRCVDVLEQEFADSGNVRVCMSEISELDADEAFDSAVLVNVLEHIDDDRGALRDLRRVLRPGGRVVVFAPAFMGLYSEFDRRIGHRRRYRLSQLVEVAHEAGFEISEARYVSSVGAVLWWLYARQLRRTPTTSPNVMLYDRVIVPTLERLERNRPPRFGQSVLLVARRSVEER